jgi:OOP family OmpA-OmpF porin
VTQRVAFRCGADTVGAIAVHRPTARGSTHTPILVFAGIVGLSVVFFFIFSAGSLGRKPPPPSAPPPATQTRAAAPSPAPTVAPPPQIQQPAGPPAAASFASLETLLEGLTARLRAEDFDSVEKLTEDHHRKNERLAYLKHVLTRCGWRVAAADPWIDAGSITGVTRKQLKLEPATPDAAVPAGAVLADFGRVQGEGWKVKTWRFDAALLTQTKALAPEGGTPPSSSLTETPDALDTARTFFGGVIGHDFKTARSVTDSAGVTHEKLAGLCIVLEEGGYRMVGRPPVRITAANDKTAWAIVKFRSDSQNLENEMGLEMERTPAGEWRVRAINFSEMLESFVKASGTGKVFYSPIVKSAKGGESIVLYFEFDRAELHPRALNQLDIIAGLLKTDPARKISITGHTDAVGSDNYNVRLSAARAKNVSERLLALGVPAAQIETKAIGSAVPLDPDKRADGSDNPEGRSRNRRTEIFLDF